MKRIIIYHVNHHNWCILGIFSIDLPFQYDNTPLTKHMKNQVNEIIHKRLCVMLTHIRLQFHYQLILCTFLMNFFDKNVQKDLNLSFYIFIWDISGILIYIFTMIIMFPKGNIPFILTKVKRLFHGVHWVWHLTLNEKQNLIALNNMNNRTHCVGCTSCHESARIISNNICAVFVWYYNKICLWEW